jgi:hypothetical protein
VAVVEEEGGADDVVELLTVVGAADDDVELLVAVGAVDEDVFPLELHAVTVNDKTTSATAP